MSTPELSFLIRHFQASGGINVSASHNHPDDNGFKFYTPEGAQDIPPYDEEMAEVMNQVATVHRRPFEDAMRDGLIRELDPSTHDAYLELNLGLRTRPASQRPIVFTPLCGTGDSTVGDVLRAAGYDLRLFEPQTHRDGTFDTVPLRMPNPELPSAAHPAVKFADTIGSSIIFATDPDADRIGVLVKDQAGRWRSMTGNEIAAILTHYLVLDRQRGPQRRGIIVKTLVTTKMMEGIASAAGCPIVGDLLVGFKYIANVLAMLDRDGEFRGIKGSSKDLVIAAEESHGVLLTPEIRDKDAAGGALLLAELCTQLLDEGTTLPDHFDAVVREHGNYTNAAASLVMRGIRGTQALSEMMESLRKEPPKQIGGLEVGRVIDYLDEAAMGRPIVSETDRISRNLIVFEMPGVQVTIRPSGTEPKVKIYADVEGRAFGIGSDRAAVRELADRITADAADTLMERIGIRLSPSAKALPEFIDLDLKRRFDGEFRQQLLTNAEALAAKSPEARRAWLREQLAAYTAGSDPLETASAAVASLVDALAAEHRGTAAGKALSELGAGVLEPVAS